MAVFEIAGLLVGACGSAAAPAASPPRTEATIAISPSAAASPAPQPDVLLAGSRYGAILFDGSGRTLYLFSADGGTDSHCYNACATAWPPFVTAHAPIVGQRLGQGTGSTTARPRGGDPVGYA